MLLEHAGASFGARDLLHFLIFFAPRSAGGNRISSRESVVGEGDNPSKVDYFRFARHSGEMSSYMAWEIGSLMACRTCLVWLAEKKFKQPTESTSFRIVAGANESLSFVRPARALWTNSLLSNI
jgi:hypothetical protein